VAVDISGGTVRRAGVALTGVGSTTVHAVEAGEALVGSALSEATIQRAAEAAAAAAKPRTDHRGSASYKRHIINTFTARVLRGIAESTEKAA
jgi:carbon-monoxide dehydrogenase medium subunit